MNNKTAENLFPQSTPGVSENADEERVELQGNKTFVAIPDSQIANMGVNWQAIFCLLLLVVAVGGLLYSVGDAFSVQHVVDKAVVVADTAVRLIKNLNANVSGSNLPIWSLVSGQITFIISGVILLSVLGLLWSLLARSHKYKNGCRQRQVLEDMIITLRDEQLKLVVGIRAATDELERETVGTKSLFTALLENQLVQSSETTSQLQCLGEGMQQMNTLVETMQDVAEQINMSSLNASIRAVTAGEAGRGFAVIAEEGQRLATLSDGVAKEINARLQNMQQAANGAISFVESTIEEAKHNVEFMRQVDHEGTVDEKITAQQSTGSDAKISEIVQVLARMKSITHKLKHTIDKFDMSVD